MRLAIYHWKGLAGYLLAKLVEGADVITVAADDGIDPAEIPAVVSSDAQLFLFHIDLTHDAPVLRPDARHRLIDRLGRAGIGVLNGSVGDISKRAIHRHNRLAGLPDTSADRHGPGGERLIVKTDLNSGGEPERSSLGRARNPIIPGPGDYRILPRREIPGEWWARDDIDIERFIENEAGEFYRLHRLGNLGVISEGCSEHDVKRMDGTCHQKDHRLDLDELSDPGAAGREAWVGAARAGAIFARTFGLDYGALDIMRDDRGRFYVIDVNKTPYWGADVETDVIVHLRSWLSR